jgi:hypothetical protein
MEGGSAISSLKIKVYWLHYIEMGVFSDEIPVCGVQYVGLLHPSKIV